MPPDVTVLEKVASGDLTQRLEIDSTDEFGRMATSLNTAVAASAKTLDDVKIAAEREFETEALTKAERIKRIAALETEIKSLELVEGALIRGLAREGIRVTVRRDMPVAPLLGLVVDEEAEAPAELDIRPQISARSTLIRV